MVKELRVRANLKQKEVAKAIGLAESSYGFMERGNRPWRGGYKEKAIEYIKSVIEKQSLRREVRPSSQDPKTVTIVDTVSNLIAKKAEPSSTWFDLVTYVRTNYKDTQFETNKECLAEVVEDVKRLGCPYISVTWRTKKNIKEGVDAPIYVIFAEKGAVIFYTVKDTRKRSAKHPELLSVLSMFKGAKDDL